MVVIIIVMEDLGNNVVTVFGKDYIFKDEE